VSATPRTLPEALAEAARGDAGYTFLSGGSETFRSYADMYTASCRVARALRDAGLRHSDLVAIVLGDAEAFLTTLFGASMASVVPAPLYPPMAVPDLSRHIEVIASTLRSAGARAVVTSRALVSRFDAVRSTCPELSTVLSRDDMDAPAEEPDDVPSLDDVAFVQFTSGSTSAPKGVVVTHRNLSANVNAVNGPSGLATTGADIGVSWLPLNHDMGLVGMAIAPVYASRPVVLMPPQTFVKRPVEWLRAISRYRATVSFAPNFAYDLCVRRVKDRDLEGLDLSCWRVAGCGAEPIHPPTLEAFAAKFATVGFRETSFLPSYGLAEHVLAATFSPRGRAPLVERLSDKVLVSCGSPFPDHEIRIVGEDGRALAERQVGEIVLAGPSVMRGYYRQETLTAEAIRDGWLHTGDLGYLAGDELFICGRASDVIIAHGRKYHPQDLEWAVDGLAGVRHGRAVAFGAVEEGRADRVIIVVEPNGTIVPGELVAAIRRRISEMFGLYVDDVALVPSGTVGRTTSGKVRRAATKAQYERGELWHRL
jgi:fatty-acyl-CoA synthase